MPRKRPTGQEPPDRVAELEKQLNERVQQIRDLERDREALRAQVEQLTAEVGRLQAEHPTFRVESLASSFTTLLETYQAQANKPTPSGIAGTLRSADVEVKGFVEVKDDKTHLVVPRPGEALDSNLLSLLRLSFVTVPTLLPSAKAPEPPPAKGAPAEERPGPRRRKRSKPR